MSAWINTKLLLPRSLVSCATFAFAVSALHAEVRYTVEAKPADGVLHLTMEISHTGKGCSLQIPNWGPGGYRLNDNFTHVQHLMATDEAGKTLEIKTNIETVAKPYEDSGEIKVASNRICTWMVAPASKTIVQYDVPSRL